MSDLDKINSIFNAKIDSVKTKEDLQNIKWSTVLDTSHVVLGGDYHIVRVSRVGRYTYISISLYGCWHQSAPTEYVRFATKEK